jgi:hypothetical protein
MFLISIIVIIVILFILYNNNLENFSGGTNIQLNSNDASPTETTLTQYRPYWLSTFYKQQPTNYSESEYAQTVSDDFNQDFDANGNSFGIINENFSCGKCNRKYNNLYNVNDYIVTNDYEQIKL